MVLALAMLLAAPVQPAAARRADPLPVLEGTVVRVVDGDTLEFRPADPAQPLIAVRLRGIDAPESCQRGGREATQALRARTEGRLLRLRVHGTDEYRRTLGTLFTGTPGADSASLNAALVESGFAWAWRDTRGHSPYLRQEATARSAARGVHADPAAEAPWDFRHRQGRCRRG